MGWAGVAWGVPMQIPRRPVQVRPPRMQVPAMPVRRTLCVGEHPVCRTIQRGSAHCGHVLCGLRANEVEHLYTWFAVHRLEHWLALGGPYAGRMWMSMPVGVAARSHSAS